MADLPGGDQVAGAANKGQSAINQFDPTATANSLNQGFNQLKQGQLGTGPQTGGEYLSAYAGQVAANPDVRTLYNQANEQFGVPQLAQRANQLNTMVTNETPQAYNLMRGFDASDAQVQNKIGTDLRFLNPQATAATNASQTAQNLAGQQVQAGITQNQMNLLPIQAYQQTMNQALAAQATGFTQDAQNQFAGLQAKMQAGVSLSTAEMQAYQQLASAKMQYDAQIKAAQIGAQYQTLQKGDTLVSTGAVPGSQAGAYNPFAAVGNQSTNIK